MHIYAFGSICRGEVTHGSDIDVLAITEGLDSRFDPDVYSVYSYERIRQLWKEGSPFAWHLALESKLVHAEDNDDFLQSLGSPTAYANAERDCEKFLGLLEVAQTVLWVGSLTPCFELSTVFLAARNFATCYSLETSGKPDFSRNSATRLGADSIPISAEIYSILQRCRLLCTRGIGIPPSSKEVDSATSQLGIIKDWMESLLHRVRT